MYTDNTEEWENRTLGASEEHVSVVSEAEMTALRNALSRDVFQLGDRIKNLEGETGTVVATYTGKDILWLNEEARNREDSCKYIDDGWMKDTRNVLVIFDDTHMEWGYYGDGDFEVINESN